MKTSASITSEKRTDGQEKQLKRLLEDGAPKAYALLLKKLDPDKDGMDRLLGNGDEVVNAMVDAILDKAQVFTTPDQYADEEASSDYRYPEEYKGPKPLDEQINMLAKIFGISGADAIAYVEKTRLVLPEGAEGWFAILSPAAIEKFIPDATDSADRYCKGVCLVLEKIAASRRFKNWREGELTPDRLRIHTRTAAGFEEIAKIQKGDILIIPAQLGLRHRGRSTRRARVCFKGGEFGLDPIAGGCIALTHPKRYVRSSELDTDLPGTEFAPVADGVFSKAPLLCFRDGLVKFGTEGVGFASVYFGSASAFLSQ